MYYRRKVILGLLELFGTEVEKIRMQKLLFLFSRRQKEPVYEFVPYKYGCFSYSASADLNAMVKKDYLVENKKGYSNKNGTKYFDKLKKEDQELLKAVYESYGKMSSKSLIKHTYINFPFWAIHSTVKEDVLNKTELNKVLMSIPKSNETVLFTIGYEGISLEEYLNRLLKNDIKLLIDVRRNPLSMKYGFSKTLLQRFCENLKIQYLHIPEVGIDSSQRQELNTQSDYDKLFETYKSENLSRTIAEQKEIFELLKKYKRIALTCFEANICQCHRKHLAESIESNKDFKYSVRHI